MTWANTAILGAATLAVVNILDSRLLSKLMPSLRAFLVPVSIMFLIQGLILYFLFPFPEDTGLLPMVVTVVSGIFRSVAIAIMLANLKKAEVSRVVPVVYTYPIFVAIMAIPLLGETLYYLEWLAIIIVVAGAVLISAQQSPSGATTWSVKALLLLFGASLLLALADIASKYALNYMSFWNMFSVTSFCVSGIYLIMSIRPHVLRELRDMKRRNSTMGLVIFNEILAALGIILQFWALERGPVYLVSTITSSRPMFVVIFALILSRLAPTFLEWQPGKGKLPLRLVAIAIIVGGMVIIQLI